MMKTQLMICLAAALTFASHADAQRNRPGKGPGVRPKAVANADFAELGALKDKFIAFRKAVYEGDGYYTDKDIEIRRAHAGLYLLIVNSVVEDRIREDASGYYIEQLFLIAEDAKKARGKKDTLPEYVAKKTKDKLERLRKQLLEEREDELNKAILTPKLNRMQVNLEELLKFGKDEKILSSGEESSLRRKLSNLSRAEQKAKSSKDVSDTEREKLLKEAAELRREFIKQLVD